MSKNRNAGAGVLSAFICSAILLLICSALIGRGLLSLENAPAVLAGANLISAFAGGICSGKRGEKRVRPAILTGVLFAAILIALAAAVDIDRLSPSSILRITAISLAGALLGGIPHLGKSNKKYHCKHKTRN